MKSSSIKVLGILFILGIFLQLSRAQSPIQRVEPPNWWVGMEHNEIQLLIYGENIGTYTVSLENSEAEITSISRVENKNYLFIDLRIPASMKSGDIDMVFNKDGAQTIYYPYPVLARTDALFNEHVDGSDVMYLITPDRFANGDEENDEVHGMKEKPNRNSKKGRHGGDLKGITEHLDYISDLGFTSIWLNPVVENDMFKYSYHGYAATDFYRIDQRYGSNQQYREFCQLAAEKDLKIIMDMIMNHCGSEHWFVLDPPTSDWINFNNKFVPTSHKRVTIQDIHASEYDKKAFSDGWFVKTMPDLNQRNPLMAKYLIQNTIWWIEYSKISGIRMDTYPYPDKDFMSDWTCAVEREYPGFFIVGEEWTTNPAIVSYWQKDKVNHDSYVSCLPSLMDFPIQDAVKDALKEDENWNSGWIKAYEMLANDFLYADPDLLVVFPDNHDMARFYTQIGNDLDLFKMGVAYFSTIRGIPQFYYGTEVLMDSDKNPGDHGLIRSDFPGGWQGDKLNAFTQAGLSSKQKEAQDFFKKLLSWRKGSKLIHEGELMQFAPFKGIYSYVRYNEHAKVLVIFNKNKEKQMIDLDRYSEIIPTQFTALDVLDGKDMDLDSEIELEARSVRILELK